MKRINMIVTEKMKNEIKAIADSRGESCSELIRYILWMMCYRIRGAKTRRHRRAKKYRFISDDFTVSRTKLSFYVDGEMHALIANAESDTDCWSKSAFLRKIFDLYIYYVSAHSEILFEKLAKQAEHDFNDRLEQLRRNKERILIDKNAGDGMAVIVEYGVNLEPIAFSVT